MRIDGVRHPWLAAGGQGRWTQPILRLEPGAWSLEQLGWISADNGRLVEVRHDTTGVRIADLYQGGTIFKIPLEIEQPPPKVGGIEGRTESPYTG